MCPSRAASQAGGPLASRGPRAPWSANSKCQQCTARPSTSRSRPRWMAQAHKGQGQEGSSRVGGGLQGPPAHPREPPQLGLLCLTLAPATGPGEPRGVGVPAERREEGRQASPARLRTPQHRAGAPAAALDLSLGCFQKLAPPTPGLSRTHPAEGDPVLLQDDGRNERHLVAQEGVTALRAPREEA